MHTLHPEVYVYYSLLYVSHSKNVLPYRYGTHRMVIQNQGRSSEDFIAYVPTFELFKTLQTKTPPRL
jgi:hypothetical protein